MRISKVRPTATRCLGNATNPRNFTRRTMTSFTDFEIVIRLATLQLCMQPWLSTARKNWGLCRHKTLVIKLSQTHPRESAQLLLQNVHRKVRGRDRWLLSRIQRDTDVALPRLRSHWYGLLGKHVDRASTRSQSSKRARRTNTICGTVIRLSKLVTVCLTLDSSNPTSNC